MAVAGVILVVFRLREYGPGIDLACFSGQVIPGLTVLVCIYSLSNFMLAFAWRHLLYVRGIHATGQWAVRAFGVFQLAKYVPGNIFRLAGRQAMEMPDAINGWALARSTIWDLGLLVLAGSKFGVLALPLIEPSFQGSWAMGVFAIVVGTVGLGIGRFVGAPPPRAFILYVRFLLVSCLLFVALKGILTHACGSLWGARSGRGAGDGPDVPVKGRRDRGGFSSCRGSWPGSHNRRERLVWRDGNLIQSQTIAN
ncbi:MAG: hypothetical protein WHS46_10965 [Desulfosoma sp.]